MRLAIKTAAERCAGSRRSYLFLGVLAARLLKEGIDPSAVDPYFSRLRSRPSAAQAQIFASLR